jgi:hypothetical protein
MHTCIHSHMYTYIHVHAQAHTHARTHTHTHNMWVWVWVWVWVRVLVWVGICILCMYELSVLIYTARHLCSHYATVARPAGAVGRVVRLVPRAHLPPVKRRCCAHTHHARAHTPCVRAHAPCARTHTMRARTRTMRARTHHACARATIGRKPTGERRCGAAARSGSSTTRREVASVPACVSPRQTCLRAHTPTRARTHAPQRTQRRSSCCRIRVVGGGVCARVCLCVRACSCASVCVRARACERVRV